MESLTVIAGAGGKKKIKFKVDKIDSVLKYLQNFVLRIQRRQEFIKASTFL